MIAAGMFINATTAKAFGLLQLQPQETNHDQRYQADQVQQPPTERGFVEEQVKNRDDRQPQSSQGGQDSERPTPSLRRELLGNDGDRGGVLRQQESAGEELKYHEHRQVLRSGGEPGKDGVEEGGAHEQRFAPDPVAEHCDPQGAEGAQSHRNQRAGYLVRLVERDGEALGQVFRTTALIAVSKPSKKVAVPRTTISRRRYEELREGVEVVVFTEFNPKAGHRHMSGRRLPVVP